MPRLPETGMLRSTLRKALARHGDTVLGTHKQLETAGQAPRPRSGTRQAPPDVTTIFAALAPPAEEDAPSVS